MANIHTVFTIDADGKPAAREINLLTGEVEDLDDAASQVAFDEAEQSAGVLGGALGKVQEVLSGPAGVAAGAAAVGAFLVKAVGDAIELGKEAELTAAKLDLDVEAASRLNTVFTNAGFEAEVVAEVAVDIGDALAEDAELAARLGVEAGQTLGVMDAMSAAIDGWDLLTPAERIAVFGDEGVKAVAAIRRQGGSLEDQMNAIADINVIDGDEAADLKDVEMAMKTLSNVWAGVQTEIAVSTAGIVADLLTIGGAASDLAEADDLGFLAETLGTIKDQALLVVNPLGVAVPAALDKMAGAVGGVSGEMATLETATDDVADAGEDMADDAVQSFDDIDRAIQTTSGVFDEWKADLDLWEESRSMSAAFEDFKNNGATDIVALQREFMSFIEDLDESTRAERTIEMQAAIRAGDLEAMEAAIRHAVRDRNIRITSTYIPGVGPPGTNQPDGATRTQINISMAGQPSSRELNRMVTQWQKNG
jgi:hypothetical protein